MTKQRTPSIRMVAERAGVSVATVSNVVNGKTSVSPAFAERVRKAVAELGYVADLSASRLRSGKAGLIGVVVPNLADPTFSGFVSTLEHAAREDGCDLVVVSSRDDPAEERDRLSAIRAWRPAGLIVIPCDGGFAARLPPNHHVPTVVADRIPDEGGFDLVAVDNGPASAAIAGHLVEQGLRRCLVVGSSLAISNVRERWEGVRSAAGTEGFEMVEVGFADEERIAALGRRLAEPRSRPDAVFALDCTNSLALFTLLGRLRLRIPDDLAYATFDEMEWMRLVSPPLTAVRQPVDAMAEAAWALLSERMGGAEGDTVTRRLTCAVTIRGSTSREAGAGRTAAA